MQEVYAELNGTTMMFYKNANKNETIHTHIVTGAEEW
jgi:hypothetical protein